MLKRRKIICTLLAAAMAFLASTPLLAAGTASPQYKETVIHLPHQAQTGIRVGLFAHADNSIDFYTESTKPSKASPEQYNHLFSPDGGKTWSAKDDMGWVPQGEIFSLYMDKNKTLYAVITDNDKNITIYRGKDGNMKKLAVPDSGSGPMRYDYIIGVQDNGDILLSAANWRDRKFFVRVLDANGKLKTEYAADTIVSTQGGQWVIGDDWKYNSDGTATGCDVVLNKMGTGKTERRLSLDLQLAKDPESRRVAWTALPDGTVYYTSKAGLFRCAPGEKSFSKVLDGAACSLGSSKNDTIFSFASCGVLPDQSVYGLLLHFDDAVGDWKNTWELVRYTPVK